jgi:hypothetical protein
MCQIYELLSKPGHLFGWQPDETMPDRFLTQGAILDDSGTVLEDLQCAVRIFADRIVEREYGESHSAHLITTDDLSGGVIVQVTPGEPTGDGGYYLQPPMSFAVRVSQADS